MENISTAVVVGAGVSGLQTARALLKRGLQVLVLEQRSEVGGVWTRDYAGFGLQVPCEFYQFAEFPWPADIERDPAHPSNAAVQAYVRAYAAHFGLLQYIRFGCQLLRLQAAPGGGWAVIYLERASGLFQVVPADFVVVATGMYSVANVPVYKGMQLFRGTQLHAKDFKDASIATGKRVVVVGAGRSALDCASMVAASRNAASVTWLFRQPHWPVPSRLASWLAMPHLIYSRLPGQLLPPYYTASAAQLSLHKLAAPGKRATWDWLQRRIARQFALEGSLVPAMSLDADLLYSGQVMDAQWNTILMQGMQQRQQQQLQQQHSGRGRDGKRKKGREAGRRSSSADANADAAAQLQQQQQDRPPAAAAAGGGSSRTARRSSFSFGACWRPGSSGSEGDAGCSALPQQEQQQEVPGVCGEPDAMPSLAGGPAGGGLVVPLCGEIERFAPDYLLLRSGGAVAADVVLYCTGYSKSYDYLDAGPRAKLGIAKDGLPLFRNILPPLLPRLGFIGSEVSSYNNVLTSGLQAEWLGDVLSGRLALPGLVAMQDDVRRLTAWRRRVFPPHRNRAAAVQLYMQQYHEQLLADRGLPAPRPAWLLQPLTAAHYASAFAPPPGLPALDGSGASESDAGADSVAAAAEAARVACETFCATGLASAAAVAAALQRPDSGRQAPAAPETAPSAADEAAGEEAAAAVADRRRWVSLFAPIAHAARRNSASSCGTGSTGPQASARAATPDAAAAAVAASPALAAAASSGSGDSSSCQVAAGFPVEQRKLPAIAALQQQGAAEECGNCSSPSSSSIATSMFARPGSLLGALLDASPGKPGRAAAGVPAGAGAVPAAVKAAGEGCNQGLAAAASKVAVEQPTVVGCAVAAGSAGEATAAAGAVAANKAAAAAAPLSCMSSGGSPLLAADGSACAIAGDSITSSLQQPPGNSSSDGGGLRHQQQAAAGGAPVVLPPATPLALSVGACRVPKAAKAGARSSKCSYTTCEQHDCCSSKLSALPAAGAVRQLPLQPLASPSDLRADVLATIESAGGFGAVRQQQVVQQWLDATPEVAEGEGSAGRSRHGSSGSSSNESYGYNRMCEQVSVGAGASSCAAALADGRPVCVHLQQQRDLQQAAAGTYQLLPGSVGEGPVASAGPAVNPRRLSNGGSAAAAALGAAEHACSASSQQQLLDDASVAAWQQLRQQQQMLQQQLVQQQMLLDQQQQQLDLQARLQQQQQARLGCGGGPNAAAAARRNSCPWPAAQAAAACGAGAAGLEFAAGDLMQQRCASARGYNGSSSCNGETMAGDALPVAGRTPREFRVAPLQLPAAPGVAAAAAAAGVAGELSVRSRAVSSPGVASAAAPTAASSPWLHASNGASARPSADASEVERQGSSWQRQQGARRAHGSSCSATGSSAAASAAATPACAGDAAGNDAAMLIVGAGSSESLPRKDAAAAAAAASGSGSSASSGWRKGLRRTASSSAAGLGGSSSSVCPAGNCEGSTSSIGRRGHSNLRKSSTASATEILDLLSEHGLCPEGTSAAEEAAAAVAPATAACRAGASAFAAAMIEPSEVLAAAAAAELPGHGLSSSCSSSGAAAGGKGGSGGGPGLLRLLVRGFSLSGSSSKLAHSGSNGVTDTSSLAGSSSVAAPASRSTHPHARRSLSSSCNGGSLLSGAPPLPLPAQPSAAAAATAPCSSNVAGSGTIQSASECGYHHQQQRLLQQRSLSSLRHIMARMQAASDALEQQHQQASLIAHLTSTQQAALKASAAAAAANGSGAPASTHGPSSCCDSACAACVLQASPASAPLPRDSTARRHSSLSAACQSTRQLPGEAGCSLARAASSPAHVTGGAAGSTSSIMSQLALAGMQPCGSLQDVLEGVPFAAQGDDAASGAAAARLPLSGPPRRRSRQLSNGSGVSAAAAAAVSASAVTGSRPSTAAGDGAAGAGPVATAAMRSSSSMPVNPVQHAWQDDRWQQWLHQQHQLVMVPGEQQQQQLLPVERPQASEAGSARGTAQLREHISRRGSGPAVQQAAPPAANSLVLNRLGSRAAALRQLRVLRQQPEAVGVLLSSLRAWQASPEAAAAGNLAAKAVPQPEPAA